MTCAWHSLVAIGGSQQWVVGSTKIIDRRTTALAKLHPPSSIFYHDGLYHIPHRTEGMRVGRALYLNVMAFED